VIYTLENDHHRFKSQKGYDLANFTHDKDAFDTEKTWKTNKDLPCLAIKKFGFVWSQSEDRGFKHLNSRL